VSSLLWRLTKLLFREAEHIVALLEEKRVQQIAWDLGNARHQLGYIGHTWRNSLELF
jgi:hypothetical protein